jgi:hypothetical protein
MRKLFGGIVLAAVALSIPAASSAQRRTTAVAAGGAKHELGIDLSGAYVSPNTNGVDGGLAILAPVSVRYGIMPRSGKIMWEPRISLNLSSVGGQTRYALAPQLNLLYANTTGGHRRGMYFAGGAGLVLGDPSGNASGTAVKLEGGVGWRKPYGSGAWRYEVGIQWVSSNDELAAAFLADYIAIGGRIGISLWH